MREKTAKFLRRQLDSYEGRFEKKEERYSSWVTRGMNALDDRPTLKRFFFVLLGLEVVYWCSVLFFPFSVLHVLEFVGEWSDKSLVLILGCVFGTGLYIAYVLFRFKFPDLEDGRPENEPVIGPTRNKLVSNGSFVFGSLRLSRVFLTYSHWPL